jgi:hypothetical protein
MPIRNQLFGVYKLLELKQSDGSYRPFLAESASRKRDMKTEAKNFIQGTAKARVLDIGAISESFNFKLPILVGGAAVMDGRSMVTTYVSQALDENSTVLPLIKSAKISISSEGGAEVDVEMISDGLPQSEPFKVTNRPVDTFAVNGVNLPLDPTAAGGPTRIAKFYDFRAKIGKFVYYIMSANISIDVNVEMKYFIAGKDSDTWAANEQYKASAMRSPSLNPLKSNNTNNPYNFNTQFPFIGVAGIKVSGGGTAAVELSQLNNTDNSYDFNDYSTTNASWETINVDLTSDGGPTGTEYELTWQLPGEVRTAADQSGSAGAGFLIEIWTPAGSLGPGYPASDGWVSLFKDSNGTDVLDLSQSVVNSSNFKVVTGVMTSEFNFTCWVK